MSASITAQLFGPRSLRVLLALAFLGVVGSGPTFADDEPELVWRKDEGKELFDRGKTEFEEGNFETAYATFKDARRHAKGQRTKIEVARWMLGSEGGNTLAALEKHAASGREGAAYDLASKEASKYTGTPIEARFQKFVEELEKKLFYVLEDFEQVSPRYSEKYGKKFIEDPAKVRQGKRCLEWEVNDKNTELKVKRLPRDLHTYENGRLVLWLYFDRGGPYSLIFNVPGADRSSGGDKIDNAYMKQMKAHKGWKKIVVKLSDFHAQGKVEWGLVKDFRIQFTGRQKFTCYVDAIMLQK